MQQSRRETFETIRAGPALFAGLPGDEVDIDRLMAHLAARGFEGGVCVSDGAGDGVLWIHKGEVDEAWFFDASGHEAVLPGVYGHDLLRDIAARGGVVGVVAGAPDAAPPVTLPNAPPVAVAPPPAPVPEPPPAPPWVGVPPPVPERESSGEGTPEMFIEVGVPETVPAIELRVAETAPVLLVESPDAEVTAPVRDPESPPHAQQPDIPTVFELPAAPAHLPIPDPPTHPWPVILQELAVRVARHRGPRLAALFTSALAKALAEYGGTVEGDRITAPPLPESTWRVIVETACAPIVSIAGRAFTDRTIAAAERAVQEGRAAGGASE